MVLQDVKILPKDELAKTLAPALVKRIKISLNLFSLLRGQVRISSLTLAQPDIKLFLKDRPAIPNFKTNAKGDVANILQEVYKLPIDELNIEGMNLLARLDGPQVALRATNLDLSLKTAINR